MSTIPAVINKTMRYGDWLFETEQPQPMQTAVGRNTSSIAGTVTGAYSEQADYEAWRKSLPGRLIDYYA